MTHSHLGLSENRPSILRFVIIDPIFTHTHTQRETLERGHSLLSVWYRPQISSFWVYTSMCISVSKRVKPHDIIKFVYGIYPGNTWVMNHWPGGLQPKCPFFISGLKWFFWSCGWCSKIQRHVFLEGFGHDMAQNYRQRKFAGSMLYKTTKVVITLAASYFDSRFVQDWRKTTRVTRVKRGNQGSYHRHSI